MAALSEIEIRPVTGLGMVQAFVAQYWTPRHPVGRSDNPMAQFYLMTPWVDRKIFPDGISVLAVWRENVCLGITCVFVTPEAAWHVIWTMDPATRGLGVGRKLLLAMREAVAPKPLYVFGISKDGISHYRATGFQTSMALRWRLTAQMPYVAAWKPAPADPEWLAYRFDRHPVFTYERRGDTILRNDFPEWGNVRHVVRLGADWPEALRHATDGYDLVQAWAYENPGAGWEMPPAYIPTVFHPPEARGNTLGVAGWPQLPLEIHGSDGMQDRWT